MDYQNQLYNKSVQLRFGRSNTPSLATLNAFYRINYVHRNYARHKQCQYERKVARLLKEALKVFHSFQKRVGVFQKGWGKQLALGISKKVVLQ